LEENDNLYQLFAKPTLEKFESNKTPELSRIAQVCILLLTFFIPLTLQILHIGGFFSG
jgi:hypothetical protein